MSSGKIYFAWVDDAEVFSVATHAREDEEVFALTISHGEGEFATASVEIRNPGIGLLAPGRKRRAFISCELTAGASPTLLFAGSLTAFPVGLVGQESVAIECVSRPFDDRGALLALFGSLNGLVSTASLPQSGILAGAKLNLGFTQLASADVVDPLWIENTHYRVDFAAGILTVIEIPVGWTPANLAVSISRPRRPQFEPLLLPEDYDPADPAVALAAIPLVVHWPRVGGSPTLSHIFAGSGFTTLTASDVWNVSVEVTEPPVTQIDVELDVGWSQRVATQFDAAPKIFAAANGGVPTTTISTITQDDLESAWTGAVSGSSSGYSVKYAALRKVGTTVSSAATVSALDYPSGDPEVDYIRSPDWPATPDVPRNRQISYEVGVFTGQMQIEANYEQPRREVVSFSVTAGIQPLFVASGSSAKREKLALKANSYIDAELETSQLVEYQSPDGETTWKTSVRQRAAASACFAGGGLSTLGLNLVQNAMQRARAKLAAAARAIAVSFECTFEAAAALTLSSSVRLSGIPGLGTCRGKVTQLTLSADADGQRTAKVTIGVAIGTGVQASLTGWQTAGATSWQNETADGPAGLSSSVMSYVGTKTPESGVYPWRPVDAAALVADPDDFCITNVTVTNALGSQNTGLALTSDPEAYLRDHPISISIALKNIEPQSGEILLEADLPSLVAGLPLGINLARTA
ncbi:hypothetical protein CHU95_20000 [Niveispirillum lacus]|uniref:Uncharacterized protein n=1 Tax=Niveispirillum lacus TaxID=1981099 RepID=A0A255YQC6_9PROT|nr:hypothetical protein [Niveispirillum lacus]OYQ31436.1 hypothetical protein CHU95_20000 [Niveispirillum lacus]